MKYRAALFLVFLILIGCATSKTRLIPQAPLYNNECKASHVEYLEMAQDTQDLAPEGSIPSDPQAALDAAHQWIEDWELINGGKISIVQKPEIGIEQFDKFTTTLPTRLYVKEGFYEMSLKKQAEILWHEIVHVRQWTRLGPDIMAALWLSPHGRMALETVAYRESVRMRILFGFSLRSNLKYAEGRAKSLYVGYFLETIPWDCYRSQVVHVLTADIAQ